MLPVADVRAFWTQGPLYIDPMCRKSGDQFYGSFLIDDGTLYFQIPDEAADGRSVFEIIPHIIRGERARAVIDSWESGKKDGRTFSRLFQRSSKVSPYYVDPRDGWKKLRICAGKVGTSPVLKEIPLEKYHGVVILFEEDYTLGNLYRSVPDHGSDVPGDVKAGPVF